LIIFLNSNYPSLPDKEIQLVTRKKKERTDNLDVDKFLESTLRAAASVKVMRADLENEMEQYVQTREARKQKLFSGQAVGSVEELIRSVPIIHKDKSLSSARLENQSVRRQLLSDQEDLNSFQQNFRSVKSVA